MAAHEQAIAIYDGELLPEDLYEEWAQRPREEFNRLFVSLLGSLARLYEEVGALERAVEVLERIPPDDPENEENYRSLMRLYALLRQPQAAAHVFRRLRQALAPLDVDPEPVTTQLFQQILSGHFPAKPIAETRTQATSHAQPRSSRPVRLGRREPPASGFLPTPLTTFVGREKEQADLMEVLAQSRLVTLTGPPGCGKTRLALELAGKVLKRFRDGVWWVDLHTISDAAILPHVIASRIDVRLPGAQSPDHALTDLLLHSQVLLVLDNCEHLLEGVARLSGHLLLHCPSLRVLATSRHTMRIPGEAAWRVPALSLPARGDHGWPGPEPDPQSTTSDAVALFITRARLVRPRFSPDARGAGSVAEICRRLDGLPLAIELAAARLNVLSPDEILSRIEDRFAFLGDQDRGTTRHRTLRSAVEWSYQLLSAAEQSLFVQLSLFNGGFSLEAVREVCWPDGREAWEVLEFLSQLVDKSIVSVEERPDGSVRYRLLETMRQYGRERMSQEERTFGQKRHADFFLRLAEEAGANVIGSNPNAWLSQLDAELDNLRAALAWSLDAAPAIGLRIAGAIRSFWQFRGQGTEGRRWVEAFLDRARERTAFRARALATAGGLAWDQGDFPVAASFLEESLGISRELDHRPGIALALEGLGLLAWHRGEYDEAQRLFEEALRIHETLGDKREIAYAFNSFGLVASETGRQGPARTSYERALEMFRELNDRRGMAIVLNNLGEMARFRGDGPLALAYLEESLELQRTLGDRRGVAIALVNLGHAFRTLGDRRRAHDAYNESLVMFQEMGNRRGMAEVLEGVAYLASAEDLHERAATLMGAADVLRATIGAPRPLPLRLEYEQAVGSLREKLGSLAWEVGWQRGKTMPTDRVLRLALDARTKKDDLPRSIGGSQTVSPGDLQGRFEH